MCNSWLQISAILKMHSGRGVNITSISPASALSFFLSVEFLFVWNGPYFFLCTYYGHYWPPCYFILAIVALFRSWAIRWVTFIRRICFRWRSKKAFSNMWTYWLFSCGKNRSKGWGKRKKSTKKYKYTFSTQRRFNKTKIKLKALWKNKQYKIIKYNKETGLTRKAKKKLGLNWRK